MTVAFAFIDLRKNTPFQYKNNMTFNEQTLSMHWQPITHLSSSFFVMNRLQQIKKVKWLVATFDDNFVTSNGFLFFHGTEKHCFESLSKVFC